MASKKDYKFSYLKSGVDVKKGNQLVKLMKPLVRQTNSKQVIGSIGGFGGNFSLKGLKFNNPVLVSATDGVGTKLLIAKKMENYKTIGIDLVAMSVNDIIVQGARPLFFLDYIAVDKIKKEKIIDILKGIVKGCKEAKCALLGGETAELPGVYPKNSFDLAGFCVGVVEKRKLLPKKNIISGDILLGLPSNGLHSNGFSLIRNIMDEKSISYKHKFRNNYSFGDIFLRPTKIYIRTLLKILNRFEIKSIAHITGGGISDNLTRSLPNNLGASIYLNELDFTKKGNIYSWLKTDCRVEERELLSTFNCGIGMILVVRKKTIDALLEYCKAIKQPIKIIGKVKNQKFIDFI